MRKMLFLLFAVFFITCRFPPNCEKFLNEKVRPGHAKGIVVTKQRSKEYCFGEVIVKTGDGLDTLKYIPYCNSKKEKDVWSNLNVGDSIFKADGELLVTIINGNGRKVLKISCLDLK